jgi:hypothetical protein
MRKLATSVVLERRWSNLELCVVYVVDGLVQAIHYRDEKANTRAVDRVAMRTLSLDQKCIKVNTYTYIRTYSITSTIKFSFLETIGSLRHSHHDPTRLTPLPVHSDNDNLALLQIRIAILKSFLVLGIRFLSQRFIFKKRFVSHWQKIRFERGHAG